MGQAKDDLDTMKEMMAEMMTELASTKDDLAITKDELAATKDELAITKADHAITKARTDELEREVAILRAPPYIPLLYSSTNTEGGGLDISAGVFTAPHGGSYT